MDKIYDAHGEEVAMVKVFKGDCKGVGLAQRAQNDKHVCLYILTEDDGQWFIAGNAFSAFWLTDLMHVLKKVQKWMEKNCRPDPNGGFVFRT